MTAVCLIGREALTGMRGTSVETKPASTDEGADIVALRLGVLASLVLGPAVVGRMAEAPLAALAG